MNKIIMSLLLLINIAHAEEGVRECEEALSALLDREEVSYKIEDSGFLGSLFEVGIYIKGIGNWIRKADDHIKINGVNVKVLCIYNDKKHAVTQIKVSTKANRTLYNFTQ